MIKFIIFWTFIALLCGWLLFEPVSVADEYIPAEIPVEKCLSWEAHKAKYPSIEGVYLLESMLQECAR